MAISFIFYLPLWWKPSPFSWPTLPFCTLRSLSTPVRSPFTQSQGHPPLMCFINMMSQVQVLFPSVCIILPHFHSCLESHGTACIFLLDSIPPAFLLCVWSPSIPLLLGAWFCFLTPSSSSKINPGYLEFFHSFYLNRYLPFALILFAASYYFISLLSSSNLVYLSVIIHFSESQFHLICPSKLSI